MVKMHLCLFNMFLLPGLLMAAVSRTEETSADSTRQKRSDDPSLGALQVAFDQLVTKVSAMEAKQTADEAKLTAHENDINVLKTKRCETGQVSFSPHGQSEVVSGEYHERRHTIHVNFPSAFSSAPWVAVSLSEMDADHGQNLRINTGTAAITPSGFDAFLYEWADSHLYSAVVTWVACTM